MGARTHYFRSARRAPIILGVLVEHPLFWECSSSTHSLGGHEHSSFKGAQALIVQRQISREQVSNCKMDMKEISSWNALLKKWGRAPIIFGGSSTHLFEGSSTHFLEGHEHSLFKEQSNGERVNKCKMNMKGMSSWKCSLEKMGARTHYFWGLEHPLFWGLEHPSF